jgi:Putative prokaryotic signal transducing protein
MTTLRTCSELEEAELVKSVLAGSGVTAFLPEENSALWSNAIGGYRVQVEDADADRANEVLRQADLPAPPAS